MQGHIHRRDSRDRKGKPKSLWYVVIDIGRDANGKRRQKWHGSYPTRKAAEIARAEIVSACHRGDYVVPSPILYGHWLTDTWLPSIKAQVKPSTWSSYERNVRLHLVKHLGHQQLRHITPLMLNSLYAELMTNGRADGKGGLSPKSVKYLHTMIHKSLGDAVDAGLLASNPAARARAPRRLLTTENELRYWTPEQLREFLASVAGTRLEAAFHLSALTGMRRGEVLGLRWKDLDFEARRVSVRHSIISVNYEVQSSTTKSHRARVVDLDPGTIEQLRAQRRRQDADRAEWGDDYRDHGLVFAKENGEPLHPESFSHAFQRAITQTDLPRIRLHDLRHTHASIALSAGVPIKVVSERLGHESPSFTLKQYSHVLPGMQAEAARLIADVVAHAGSDAA